MRRFLIGICVALAAMASWATADDRTSVAVSPVFAVPLGDFGDVSNVGFGLEVVGSYVLPDPRLALFGSAGYVYFLKKTEGSVERRYSVIPIVAGMKFNVVPDFYIGAQLGLHRFGVEASGFGQSESASENEFGFAPLIGYQAERFDISAQYVITDIFDYISIRVSIPIEH